MHAGRNLQGSGLPRLGYGSEGLLMTSHADSANVVTLKRIVQVLSRARLARSALRNKPSLRVHRLSGIRPSEGT